MALKDKLRKAGIGLGLAGVLGASGCGATIAGLGVLRGNPAAVAFGQGITALEAAEAGKTQVNINGGNGQNTQNTLFGNLIIVSCNYIRDFNLNGFLDYPEDYVGIKRGFYPEERIIVYMGTFSSECFGDLKYELLNNKGEVIENLGKKNARSLFALYNETEAKTRESWPNGIPKGQVNYLEEGDYRAVWYSGNRLVGMLDFQIKK